MVGQRGRPPRGVREAILSAVVNLIREQGLSGVTTAAVAARAGASEASIHYHFGGKQQLLEESIRTALAPLRDLDPDGSSARGSARQSLAEVAARLERVYDELIPILVAVQSDTELRTSLAPKLALQDFGPHRAIALVARQFEAGPRGGKAAVSDDAEALGLLLVGGCFLRAWQRQVSTHRAATLPELSRALAVLMPENGGGNDDAPVG